MPQRNSMGRLMAAAMLGCFFSPLVAVNALAHGTVTPFPKQVQDGVPLTNLTSTGEADTQVVYRIEVPAGTQSIKVSTSGGTGDCDLYLRFGAHPDLDQSLYDASSTQYGNDESVTFTNPTPGVWFIGLHAPESYTGVRLSLTTTLAPGSIPLPRFSPGPGVFGNFARISMRSPLAGASILYTLDGSEPGLLSPVARGLITVTTDTTLRARLRTRSGALGPIASADYWVFSDSEVVSLQSGLSIDHLCGSNSSRRYFKITVKAGETLTVQAEGGTGSTSLQVRYGAPPVVRPSVSSDAVWTGAKKVQIKGTKAGDYYILLQGRGNFSNRSLTAISVTDLPDLVAWAPSLNPYITTETFSPVSCEVEEGMTTAGSHRLLRFTTESRNIGGNDIVMPSPIDNPYFEYQACHGHYHFKGFASYRLLDKDGNVAKVGSKVSFCLLDVLRWNRSAAAKPKYDCDHQGIQAGWSDLYDSGLPGQWVEIDGLAAGNYQLEITMNPERILEESDYTNNVTVVPVVIPAP